MVVTTGDVRLPSLLRRDAGAEIERLYRRHSGEVLRYALLVLRSRSDAEDVSQAVFMRALRAIDRGERVRSPHNWLIKIAHNECLRLLASRKLYAELPEQVATEPEEAGRAEELKRALEALPEAQRRALVLRELEGRPYVEIAAALGLSVSAVETLIFRGRRSLREQLEGALSCEEFPALLGDPSERARVRAHARVCATCATLERQARGRKSALKRIASSLGLPWWGAKLAAVALTTATVAGGVAAAVPPSRHAPPEVLTLIPRSGPGITSLTAVAKTAPAVRKRLAHPVVAPPRKVPGPARVSGTPPAVATRVAPRRAVAEEPPVVVPPVPVPPPSPEPAPDASPPTPAATAAPPPSAPAPQPAPAPVAPPALLAVPDPVAVPVPAVPDPVAVPVPTVSVPVPVPPPPVPIPTVSVPTPPPVPPLSVPVKPLTVSAP